MILPKIPKDQTLHVKSRPLFPTQDSLGHRLRVRLSWQGVGGRGTLSSVQPRGVCFDSFRREVSHICVCGVVSGRAGG